MGMGLLFKQNVQNLLRRRGYKIVRGDTIGADEHDLFQLVKKCMVKTAASSESEAERLLAHLTKETLSYPQCGGRERFRYYLMMYELYKKILHVPGHIVEIGVFRALGWRRRSILGLIMKESLLLGLLGGIAGIAIALIMIYLFQKAPMVGGVLTPVWDWDVFVRAILVALMLGLFGGIYPAYRATRLQPVEALRYE